MPKINVEDVPWETASSPNGRFHGSVKQLSVALGGALDVGVWGGGHPFDVATEKLAPGETFCPYHSHLVQWEMFYILSGTGAVRAGAERYEVRSGDVILHPPGEAHQMRNSGTEDLVYLIIADNPQLDVCRYPDSNKTGIFSPTDRQLFRTADVDYWDGED